MEDERRRQEIASCMVVALKDDLESNDGMNAALRMKTERQPGLYITP